MRRRELREFTEDQSIAESYPRLISNGADNPQMGKEPAMNSSQRFHSAIEDKRRRIFLLMEAIGLAGLLSIDA